MRIPRVYATSIYGLHLCYLCDPWTVVFVMYRPEINRLWE